MNVIWLQSSPVTLFICSIAFFPLFSSMSFYFYIYIFFLEHLKVNSMKMNWAFLSAAAHTGTQALSSVNSDIY